MQKPKNKNKAFERVPEIEMASSCVNDDNYDLKHYMAHKV